MSHQVLLYYYCMDIVVIDYYFSVRSDYKEERKLSSEVEKEADDGQELLFRV